MNAAYGKPHAIAWNCGTIDERLVGVGERERLARSAAGASAARSSGASTRRRAGRPVVPRGVAERRGVALVDDGPVERRRARAASSVAVVVHLARRRRRAARGVGRAVDDDVAHRRRARGSTAANAGTSAASTITTWSSRVVRRSRRRRAGRAGCSACGARRPSTAPRGRPSRCSALLNMKVPTRWSPSTPSRRSACARRAGVGTDLGERPACGDPSGPQVMTLLRAWVRAPCARIRATDSGASCIVLRMAASYSRR